MYSHLVVPSKFVLPPTTHVVKDSLCTHELFAYVLAIIQKGISYRQLLDEGYGLITSFCNFSSYVQEVR